MNEGQLQNDEEENRDVEAPAESGADDKVVERAPALSALPDAASPSGPEKEEMSVSVDAITIDPRLQMRADRHDEDYIEDLVRSFRKKPPRNGVTIFRDPQGIMWLADGHARVEAHRRLGATEILASVRNGGFRDAWKFALKANSRHGARRTKADIRLCVETALADAEMHSWSAGKIARACAVSPRTVQVIRKKLTGANDAQVPELREGADGKMYRTKKGASARERVVDAGGNPPNAGADHADTERADADHADADRAAPATTVRQRPNPVSARTPAAIDQDLSWIEKHSLRLRERVSRVLNEVRIGAKPARDIAPLRALRDELDEAIRAFEAGSAT